jgi:hypothetical protein
MSNEYPPQAPVMFWIIWLWLSITFIVWQVRNPTANVMTVWTRLPHVLSFEKLAEYQVVETHVSIGKPAQ